VSKVRELLGRPYALKGKVVFGKEKGKSLGFPTANIVPNSNLALPPNGAYISKAYVRNRAFKAVTNIGVQPTFGEGKRMIETHLLNFEGDLYNRELKVEFVKRIRGEMKFNSIEELKAQIGRDVELAKGRF
jgi:riboflavin kinase/FMN adenylyltransferase